MNWIILIRRSNKLNQILANLSEENIIKVIHLYKYYISYNIIQTQIIRLSIETVIL